MFWGRSVAFGVAALALVSLSGDVLVAEATVTSVRALTPRVVAVVAGEPGEFAATDTHAAWIDFTDCDRRIRRVHLLSFRNSRPATLRMRLCEGDGVSYGPLSIDHGRAVWVTWTHGNTEYGGRVSIAGPGDRGATTLKKFHFDIDPQLPEPWVTLAGDRTGAVIALAGPVFGVVKRGTRLLFPGSWSSSVDVSGNRVAVVRPEIRERDEFPRVPPSADVHDRRTGALLADFPLPDEGNIAVSAQMIAIWRISRPRDRIVVDCYDDTGQTFASKDLGPLTSFLDDDAIGIVGARVVYSRGTRRVYAWDPRSGVESLLAVAKRRIHKLVVTEHAAVWTEAVDDRHFAILKLEIRNADD